MLFFYCSLAISLITITLNIYLVVSFRKIRSVNEQPIMADLPPVAIIIAVRNEEEDLAKALQSVCHINYSNSRIIVVNDRSTDRTADILQDFKVSYPQLTITTVTALPDGWLGKNNALYQGYLSSTEEWMLFTDADIVFHTDALSKAVSYAVANKLDHLAILPRVVSPSPVLNSVLATFTILLMMHLQPWDAKKPGSKAYIGIGAFNLVRRVAYEKAGTHALIKLRPDDDLQLGFKIKSAGLSQDALIGNEYVSLEWYKNLRQLGNGLLKNSFSVANYNTGKAIANSVLILISVALPMPLMFIFGSATVRLMAGIVLLTHIGYMAVIPPNKWWYAFMIPFAGFFMAYTTLRATYITLKQGGIYWRESFYSLDMLKGKL
ncbi:glycosyltransferase family 2 protein [Mucilaginibacter sp.]|uniref:glycosyltransferase n=1 Tax=Mucilaginibacter sp. TaxID=1882438 RepID=UPI002C8CB97D|nr:glycosyltransferase family 2 protein [Mucilaginibacter sp.]HTI59458.1 glycosyltransferase family 2 protein [Mucilaginibacter sp.]